jgi:hypothetical protein
MSSPFQKILLLMTFLTITLVVNAQREKSQVR